MEIYYFTYQIYCLSIGLVHLNDHSYNYYFAFKRPFDRLNVAKTRQTLTNIRNCPPPCSRAGVYYSFDLSNEQIAKKVLDKIKEDHYNQIPDSYKKIYNQLEFEFYD